MVPIPRLREGLFQAVVPPFDAAKHQLQQASQRFGMKKWGKSIGLDDKVNIDMVVLGSVAVDKKGISALILLPRFRHDLYRAVFYN